MPNGNLLASVFILFAPNFVRANLLESSFLGKQGSPFDQTTLLSFGSLVAILVLMAKGNDGVKCHAYQIPEVLFRHFIHFIGTLFLG